jgi:hypothetical protein
MLLSGLEQYGINMLKITEASELYNKNIIIAIVDLQDIGPELDLGDELREILTVLKSNYITVLALVDFDNEKMIESIKNIEHFIPIREEVLYSLHASSVKTTIPLEIVLY